jgi:predicted O-linked N-acetylglucosamine transferase (SPINDLY family)
MARVPELVAGNDAQYVEIAARLVGDEALRRSLRERLREGSRAVFEDDRAIHGFADYLRQARR